MSTAIVLFAQASWVLGPRAAAASEPLSVAHEVGRIQTPMLDEISGLAASRQNPGVLWVHNDGPIQEVFAVATDGRFVSRVRIPVRMDDVEDIAIGPGPKTGVDYLYLGDIGDNHASRREVRLVRFEEPALASAEVNRKAEGVEEFRLTYPDGAHDAETLMVDPLSGDVFIVTKQKLGTGLYRLEPARLREKSSHTLELVDHLQFNRITGGDISPAGDFVVLRREERGWLWARRPEESVPAALKRGPRRVLVKGVGQSQHGEAIGFHFDGRRYYTVSEGEHEPIYVFPLPSPSGGASD